MLSALKASTSVVIVRIRESKFLSPVKEQEIQVDLLYGIQWDDREKWIQELTDFFTRASLEQLEDFQSALFSNSFQNYERNVIFKVAEVLGAFRLESRTKQVKESVQISLENTNS